MNKRLNKEELIKLIDSLDLDKNDFTILSSGALVFRGIMDDAGDLDIAVTEKGFDKLSKKFSLKDKGNNFYKVNDLVECILDDMDEKKELLGNYYLQDINYYLEFLEASNREKDKLRMSIVKKYIMNNMQYKSIEEQNNK